MRRGIYGLIIDVVSIKPWLTIRVLVLSLLAGLVEGVGVATILPLLGEVTGTGGGATAQLREFMISIGVTPTLGLILVFMVGVVTLKAIVATIAAMQTGFAAASIGAHLRLELIRAVMAARWEFFVGLSAGKLTPLMTGEIKRAVAVYGGFCTMIASLIQASVYLALALWVAWQATLAALVFSLVTAFVLNTLIRTAREAGEQTSVVTESLTRRLIEAIGAIKPLKAMGLERHVVPLLEHEVYDLEDAQRRSAVAAAKMDAFYEPAVVLLIAIALYLAVTQFQMPFSELAFLTLTFHRTATRLGSLQSAYQRIAANESAFRATTELTASARQASEALQRQSSDTLEFKGSIHLAGVTFGHGDNPPVLDNLDLSIREGGITVLIGPSGSGKTTVLDLLSGLNSAQGGNILINGDNLTKARIANWREAIGYVPQDTFIFHDTLFANIALGDAHITREMAEQALRDAGGNFLDALAEGLDTVLGERGSRLSGGQRQRIGLARAFVRNPKLLILDEASSALDADTEKEILRALNEKRGKVTMVFATHQFAVQDIADVVYRIENGRAVLVKSREAAE